MKTILTRTLTLTTAIVAGCAHAPRPSINTNHESPAVRIEPVKPVQLVEIPQLLPLPGQLKRLPDIAFDPIEPADPAKRVESANAAARIEPTRSNFINANQVWPYNPDALYQVYASPERVTDIALETGETLISVSAGDTVRWVIGDTTSGEGAGVRVHILVKPIRPALHTNLLINSDRRTYHLELTSTAATWMAAVSWQYPLDSLAKLKEKQRKADQGLPVADGVNVERLNFDYEIAGPNVAWRPIRAFDDGEKVYIQFPNSISQSEMPPLFIVNQKTQSELVNYRVRSPYYVVDRLFEAAELRLGGQHEVRVRIERRPRTGRST